MFDIHAISHDFGKAAEQYDEHALLQQCVREMLTQLAAQHFPARANILDLGCGTGAFASECGQEKWRIIGLDVSHGMCVASAHRSFPAINAGAQRLPIRDAVFEGIFSSLMLQWIDTPLEVFSEMARVLKKNGRVAFSTLVQGTLTELRTAFATIDDNPHVSAFLEPHQLLKSAANAGFSLVLAQQSRIVEHYANTIQLMRALRAIGATNKQTGRRKGLMTPKQFSNIERAYSERHRTAKGLPATWQVLYVVLEKN